MECLQEILILLEIKFGETQISVPKIGIPFSKTVCVNYCKLSSAWHLKHIHKHHNTDLTASEGLICFIKLFK